VGSDSREKICAAAYGVERKSLEYEETQEDLARKEAPLNSKSATG